MSTQKNNSMKLTSLEKKWILYDVGNSAFTLLISTIFPIYFEHLTSSAGVSNNDYLAYWGYAASIATIFVVLLGPIMGTFADFKDNKKKLLTISMMIGVIACVCLGFVSSWIAFIVIFIIAKVGYSMSLIFYDSMLTDITTNKRMDKVSSFGYAWGYIGSCVPFIVSLVIVLFYKSIGLTFNVAMIIAFALNGIWWCVMTLPLLKNYKQKYFVEPVAKPVINSFKRLKNTLLELSKDKKTLLFLLAYFFYIDGVYTIIDMATTYGKALGLDTNGLLLALLLTQIVAFPCAIIFGRLSQKFNSEKLISVCIAAYFAIAVYAIFLSTQAQFWILAVCVGIFQGGIQGLSRSYFGKLINPEKSGEYYGILDICGKGAAFLGTMLVSVLTQLTNNSSVGVSVIAILIAIGFVLFKASLKCKSIIKND